MRSITATFLVWLLVASAQQAPPAAQTATTPPAPQQLNGVLTPKGGYTIHVNSQLVIETVIVKDKQGKPVPGLTAKDFVVSEDGKKQDVKICQFQTLDETPTVDEKLDTKATVADIKKADAEAKVDKNAVQAVAKVEIAPEKPGDVKYKDRRLLVMFFDMTSMPIPDQVRAQKAALKYLKEQMTPSDLVAIMVFGGDVHVLQDFTDDRDQLAKLVKGLTIGSGQGFGETDTSDAAGDTGDAFTADDSDFNVFNTDRQLSALETAIRMLGSLSEKKALLYFASGMTRNGTDNDAQLRATENAAMRANVAIYAIDARGLVASAPMGDASKANPGGQAMYSGSSARAAQGNLQGSQETLYTLATDTGGKVLLDNNDLSMGIVQAQKDISSYYIVGYYSTNDKADGKFRSIKIEVTKTELAGKISAPDYRHGYYADKEFGKFTSADKERQLSEALMLGDPMTDIHVQMEIDHFRLARDRYFVPIEVKIPGSEFVLAKSGGAEKTVVDFILAVKDSKGKDVQNVRDLAEVKLKTQTAAELAKAPLAYSTGFTLAPGTYNFKFLARDNATGKMGSFDTTYTIPDLTNEQKSLPISSVVLSSQRADVSQAVFNASKDKKLLEANPLYQDGKNLVPSVTRVFSKNGQMYVYLEAYEPLAASTEPLMATVSFYRGKVLAFQTAPLEVTDGLNAKSKAIPLKFELPLSKLAAGRYTCQVSVLNPTAQKFAFWRAPVMVIQ
jgi:VWFA-related protein